eukprot:CAMPEP_0197582778 /NCGR_PEP_ID=MMETSP1326-20131121/5898_1 /TAXON_ID=1155430 /ORGANISM="Genus nov. species nov., Strain RCC2288" /LENGTH=197 /DNA_ID=CAMNT_0043146909 /DNA_START=67 /DNA_END=657 /DNA_ORIENTATION=-
MPPNIARSAPAARSARYFWLMTFSNVVSLYVGYIVNDSRKGTCLPHPAENTRSGNCPSACSPSFVDTAWHHTGNSCKKGCENRTSATGITYSFNNAERIEHSTAPKGTSTLKRRKGTRWGTDQAVIDFVASERTAGRGAGHILGISGTNYFDIFNHGKSTFTTADYPDVSCEDLPYDKNTFDYVICNQVLEHVRKPW